MSIFQIVVSGPFSGPLDYLTNDNSLPFSQYIGCRVQVKLNRSIRVGIIIGVSEKSSLKSHQLRKIDKLIDSSPRISQLNIELLSWFKRYYHCSIYAVFNLALPKKFMRGYEYKEKRNIYFVGSSELDKIDLQHIPKKAVKQRKLFVLLHQKNKRICQLDIKESQIQKPTLDAFLKKGWIEKKETAARPIVTNDIKKIEVVHNDSQLETISAVIKNLNLFKVHLLYGVTGSGKTEVYIQIVKKVLEENKQVLVLVPEIGLTPQTVTRFRERFTQPVLYIHSKISDNDRYRGWNLARKGQAGIIIATRSGVFTQLKSLGLIIIDEEHDLSFKQQSGIRYHARDVAIMRAKFENIPIVLGSATPSLESLYRVKMKSYEMFSLKNRAGSSKPCKNFIIDMNQTVVQSGLSKQLLEKMAAHLERNSQVLLFVNRRGYAPILRCHDCGWIKKCSRCERPYTFYNDPQQLCCHYCGSIEAIVINCDSCTSENISPIGVGTEQMEEFLNQYFHNKKTLRIDRGNITTETSLKVALDKIYNYKADIIIGTQMIAKGHHFPNLTMVGIINIDGSLYSGDYRATERVAQLIIQVSGRAGRSSKQGEVYLQTYQPDNYFLKKLFNLDYLLVCDSLLEERKLGKLPPYRQSIILRGESPILRNVIDSLDFIVSSIYKNNCFKDVYIYGPMPCLVAKTSGKYRHMIILKSEKRNILHKVISWVEGFVINKNLTKVRYSFDIDPQEMS